MSSALPSNPNLSHLKKQAKDLLGACRSGDPQVCSRLQEYLPRFSATTSPEDVLSRGLSLHDAQYVVAREYGFDSWASLRAGVAEILARIQSERRTDSCSTAPNTLRSEAPWFGSLPATTGIGSNR